MPEEIVLSPTWEGIFLIHLEAYITTDPEHQQTIVAEFRRMAQYADKWIEYQNSLEREKLGK